jgi:hypothetical protein
VLATFIEKSPHAAPHAGNHTFLASDPEQVVLRRLIGAMTEDQLIQIEDDLDYYGRTGMLTQRLDRLLEDAGDLRQLAA